MENERQLFAKNYLVYGLTPEEIEKVANLAEFGIAKPGVNLMRKGDRSGDLIVVLSGTVLICAEVGVVVAEREPFCVLGEIALVDGQPRSAYAVAKGNVHYAKLDATQLRKFMFDNKDIGFILLCNLARVLSSRLREATKEIEDLQGQVKDPWELSR